MTDKNDSESHIRTMKDLLDIFEPYLTAEDIQEVIEELADMRGNRMRLIDADALKEKAFGKRGGLIHSADVDKMSTIEERKNGKWIVTSEFDDCCYAKCNQCNVTQKFYYGKPLTNYCPNCGSRNIEEVNRMRIDLPCCGFKNCRYSFDGNCTKPSKQEKCEYLYLLHEELYKPEPHWIPCSEGLPHDKDYDETFIVTIQCEHVDGWDDYVTRYADWTPHGWDIQSYYLGQMKVTAWMPLPEPYREEGEN